MTIGWGTITYGVAAGSYAGVALTFLLIGTRRRRFDPLMISLGAYALVSALATIVTVRLHRSTSVEEYERWFKPFGLTNLLLLIALVLMVAVWTSQIPRLALIAIGIATAVIGTLAVVLPNGLLQGDIVGLRDVSLFGETFVVHEGTTSPWRPVLDVYLVATLAMLVVAVGRGFRSGRGSFSAMMVFTLAVGVAFGAYDSGVDFGVFDTPYMTPLGGLGIVVASSVFLAERDALIGERLQQQMTRLEETVVERTAALIETNRRLDRQLTQQRRSTRSLESLAEEFERSNELVDPTPSAIEASLRAILERLAAILPAATVELRIDDQLFDGLLPRRLSWHEPTAPRDIAVGPVTERTDLSEPITIGERTVGAITARSVDERDHAADSVQYLGLAAEHLAGMIHRLELVELVAASAVETERRRIAMDLHDSVTQRMYSVAFLADAAVHQASTDPANMAEPVGRIRELVLSSLAELRALLLELRPLSFDESELAELIGQLADNLASTCEPEIVVDTQPVPPLPTRTKTELYRISQEALSNACRHSQADQIIVTLHHDDDTTTLRIHDDGIGFDPAAAKDRGTGLQNLRTRARRIDTDLDIASHPGTGTTVTVRHRLNTPVSPDVGAVT